MFKASNIFYFRDYNEKNESSLMSKYQALSEFYDKMTQNKVNKRPESCQQILKDRNLWALMDNEFSIYKEFKRFSDNCDEQYKKSYVYKLIELMTKNRESDLRHYSDSDYSSEVSDATEDSSSPALKRIKTTSP